MEIKVGDRVLAFGVMGTVDQRYGDQVRVTFDTGHIQRFYDDGKLHFWHEKPSLFVVNGLEDKIRMLELDNRLDQLIDKT